MPRDVARDDIYRPDLLNLWVEDGLTRSYLSTLWDDPKVKFWIGGGNESIKPIVGAAGTDGLFNVFGLIDRDFRQSNKAAWSEPNRTFRTFVLPVHEIENYLLDPDALADCRFNTLNRTREQIDAYLMRRANELCWWVACCAVVAELRRRFRADFLPDPKLSVVEEAEARRHICDDPWFQKLPNEVAISSESEVRKLLQEAHAKAMARLSDGSWRREFPGKQLFHDLGSRICDHNSVQGPMPRGALFDADLAKQVAIWQKSNQSIPADLADLLAALKGRFVRGAQSPSGDASEFE